MASGTRERMIAAATRLFQRDGYAATGWRDVVEAGGTPWGSVHHHFPGGKEQLGLEAIAFGSAEVLALLEQSLVQNAGVDAAVQAWFCGAGKNLIGNQFECGCAVAVLALEMARAVPAMGDACAAAFRAWQDRLAQALRDAGIGADQAARLACQAVAAFEGGLLLARSWQEVAPLEIAGEAVADAIRAALPDRGLS